MKLSIKHINRILWDSHKKTKDLVTMADLRNHSSSGVVSAELPVGNMSTTRNEQTKRNNSYNMTQFIGLFLGPLLFLLILFFLPLPGLSDEGRSVLAITAWIAVWWILESIPLGITSLLPLVLLPVMGAVGEGVAAASYGNPLIFLFIGGFALALALERWNLHERIAITIISAVGTSTPGLVLGFMLATGLISMWVSNMATVMLMLPIGTAIITKVVTLMKEDNVYSIEEEMKFTISSGFNSPGSTISSTSTITFFAAVAISGLKLRAVL